MLTVVRRGTPPNLEKPTEIVRGAAARLAWAWDGLCFAVPLNEASNDGLRDVVTNVAPSVVVDNIWTWDDRGNPVLRFVVPGSPPYVEWPDNRTHDRPSTAVTAYVRMRRLPGDIPDSDGGAFTNPYGFTDPWETWAINASSTDPAKLYGVVGVGTTQLVTGDTATVPTGGQVSVFVRWQSGEAPRIDVLGERGDTITSLTGSTTASGSLGYAAGQGIRLNCHESTDANYYGYYSQAMVWSRRLTDVEMASLVADPFGWYAPRRETTTVAGTYALAFGAGEMKFGTGSGGLR